MTTHLDAIRSGISTPLFRLFRSFALLAGAELIAKGVALATMTHVARTAGVSGFGGIGLATAVVGYFALGVDGGLGILGQREVAGRGGNPVVLGGQIIVIRVALALVASLLLLLVTPVLPYSPQVQRLIVLSGLGLFTLAASPDWAFIATHETHTAAGSSLLSSVLLALGVFLFLRAPSTVWVVPVSQAIADGCAALLLIGILFRWGKRLPPLRLEKSTALRLLRGTFPIGCSSAMRVVSYSFDLLVIGAWLSAASAGWYSAAYKLVLLVLGFGALFFRAFLPAIANSLAAGRDGAAMLLQQTLLVLGLAVCPLIALGMVLATPLIRLVYGTEFGAAALPLAILLPSSAWVLLHGVFKYALVATGREALYLRLTAVTALLNVSLNLALIRVFGLNGAAGATLMSESVLLVACYASVYRLVCPVKVGEPLLATALVSGTTALAALSARPAGALVAFLAGVITYVALLAAYLRYFGIPALTALRASVEAPCRP